MLYEFRIDGEIVENGTHVDLMKTEGAYFRHVKSQDFDLQ